MDVRVEEEACATEIGEAMVPGPKSTAIRRARVVACSAAGRWVEAKEVVCWLLS